MAGTLYELLTTRLPVRTEHLGLSRRFHALMNDAPTPIETFRPQVPKKLCAIIHRCLMCKPDERFAVPGELAVALTKHAAGCDLKCLYGDAELRPADRQTGGADEAIALRRLELCPLIRRKAQVDESGCGSPASPQRSRSATW